MTRIAIKESTDGSTKFLFKDFDVIEKYNIRYADSVLYKDFDIYMFTDELEWEYYELKHSFDLHNIPYIGGPRLSKYNQYLYLNNNSIKTPDFYYTLNDGMYDDYYRLTDNIQNDEEIIIKILYGAKGIGQILLKKGDLHDFFKSAYDTNGLSDEDFVEMWHSNMGSESVYKEELESNYIREHILENRFFINRRIFPDNEFRLVYLASQPDEPLVVLRNKTDSWQAKSNKLITFDILCDEYKLDGTKLLNDMSNIASTFDYLFYCLDLYTIGDEYGVFEFQTLFGYAKHDITKLPQQIVDSVKLKVENKLRL